MIQGQPSWRIASSRVEAFLTEKGGHLGPVSFQLRRGKQIAPYSVAPWAGEKLPPSTPTVIRALRGDFFCLPFGGNGTTFHGEQHPVHGETANARWRCESLERAGTVTSLHARLKTRVRNGQVDKKIILVDEETAIYSEHVISGMKGPMPLGHHAMLRFPDEPESGRISTSPFLHGEVFPGRFEEPAEGGYSILEAGATFSSLKRVLMITGETADLTRYPARRGFEDLVMLVSDPGLPFAWTAVTFPDQRFVWFALKDPRVLAGTILWMSNGGRHYPPWNGRHTGVLGLEEVTAYFHYGLAESARANPFSRLGYPTSLRLHETEPLVVRYIMGVAAIPPGFDRVVSVEPVRNGHGIELRSSRGKRVRAAVNVDFLSGE